MSKALLAVTECSARRELAQFLAAKRCTVIEPNLRGLQAADFFSAQLFVIECSASAPRQGLGLIERCRSLNPRVPVIACSVRSSEDLAVAAFRLGVKDYFLWPEHQQELFQSVSQNLPCMAGAVSPNASGNLAGQSGQIRAVAESIRRAASTESNVLITGETGTGKELVAQSLHHHSARGHKQLVSVNCAAIPDTLLESELFGYERGAFTGATTACEGKLRLANGGTIFFDEVGDMNAHGQAKLLRAVETREVHPLGGRRGIAVDMRIVAATNQNLESMVRQGSFRADLLFRLNVIRIDLPPLRERSADVPTLLDHFVRYFNKRWGLRITGFDDECLTMLANYNWPGNVRELKNVVEAVYVNSRGGVITKNDLPAAIQAFTTGAGEIDERRTLIDALFAMNWNVSKVAEKLHWSRMTVYRKLARYQVSRKTESL